MTDSGFLILPAPSLFVHREQKLSRRKRVRVIQFFYKFLVIARWLDIMIIKKVNIQIQMYSDVRYENLLV